MQFFKLQKNSGVIEPISLLILGILSAGLIISSVVVQRQQSTDNRSDAASRYSCNSATGRCEQNSGGAYLNLNECAADCRVSCGGKSCPNGFQANSCDCNAYCNQSCGAGQRCVADSGGGRCVADRICNPGEWGSPSCGGQGCASDSSPQCNGDGSGWNCVWNPGNCGAQAPNPSSTPEPPTRYGCDPIDGLCKIMTDGIHVSQTSCQVTCEIESQAFCKPACVSLGGCRIEDEEGGKCQFQDIQAGETCLETDGCICRSGPNTGLTRLVNQTCQATQAYCKTECLPENGGFGCKFEDATGGACNPKPLQAGIRCDSNFGCLCQDGDDSGRTIARGQTCRQTGASYQCSQQICTNGCKATPTKDNDCAYACNTSICEAGCYSNPTRNNDCKPFCKSSCSNGCQSENSLGGVCKPSPSPTTTAGIGGSAYTCDATVCKSGCKPNPIQNNDCNSFCDTTRCAYGCLVEGRDTSNELGGICAPELLIQGERCAYSYGCICESGADSGRKIPQGSSCRYSCNTSVCPNGCETNARQSNQCKPFCSQTCSSSQICQPSTSGGSCVDNQTESAENATSSTQCSLNGAIYSQGEALCFNGDVYTCLGTLSTGNNRLRRSQSCPSGTRCEAGECQEENIDTYCEGKSDEFICVGNTSYFCDPFGSNRLVYSKTCSINQACVSDSNQCIDSGKPTLSNGQICTEENGCLCYFNADSSEIRTLELNQTCLSAGEEILTNIVSQIVLDNANYYRSVANNQSCPWYDPLCNYYLTNAQLNASGGATFGSRLEAAAPLGGVAATAVVAPFAAPTALAAGSSAYYGSLATLTTLGYSAAQNPAVQRVLNPILSGFNFLNNTPTGQVLQAGIEVTTGIPISPFVEGGSGLVNQTPFGQAFTYSYTYNVANPRFYNTPVSVLTEERLQAIQNSQQLGEGFYGSAYVDPNNPSESVVKLFNYTSYQQFVDEGFEIFGVNTPRFAVEHLADAQWELQFSQVDLYTRNSHLQEIPYFPAAREILLNDRGEIAGMVIPRINNIGTLNSVSNATWIDSMLPEDLPGVNPNTISTSPQRLNLSPEELSISSGIYTEITERIGVAHGDIIDRQRGTELARRNILITSLTPEELSQLPNFYTSRAIADQVQTLLSQPRTNYNLAIPIDWGGSNPIYFNDRYATSAVDFSTSVERKQVPGLFAGFNH